MDNWWLWLVRDAAAAPSGRFPQPRPPRQVCVGERVFSYTVVSLQPAHGRAETKSSRSLKTIVSCPYRGATLTSRCSERRALWTWCI